MIVALQRLRYYVVHFIADKDVVAVYDWAAKLKKERIDYKGDEVKTAQMVTLAQLRPALPPPEACGRIGTADPSCPLRGVPFWHPAHYRSFRD